MSNSLSIRPARVVTFGEMLLRLSPHRYEAFFESPPFHANFGGCEANVAVAVAHLGVPCAYVTVLPNNALGDAAIAALHTEGVDTSTVQRADGRLGIYFVELGTEVRPTRVVYDRAHSAFAEHAADTMPDWPGLLHGASWFHGSGITPALGHGPSLALATAVAAAHAAGVPVSIDLNSRPALWGERDPRPLIAPLIHGCDLLIGNAIAVRAMLSVDATDDATATSEGARDLAHRLAAKYDTRRVALTRRVIVSEREHVWSAALYDATTGEFAHSRAHHVNVVDRVGGGDSFAAALIASVHQGRSLGRALEFAVAASAHKLTVPGDWLRLASGDVERLSNG